MKTLYYDPYKNNVSPDLLLIEKLNINKSFHDGDAFMFTQSNEGLFVGDFYCTHTMFHGENRIEGRGGKDLKLVTVGSDGSITTKDVYKILKKISEKKGTSIRGAEPGDLSDYALVFVKNSTIYLLEFDELLEEIQIPYNLDLRRLFNLREKIEKLMPYYSGYKEDCSYGLHKIGNIDVAEFHLLKYEE